MRMVAFELTAVTLLGFLWAWTGVKLIHAYARFKALHSRMQKMESRERREIYFWVGHQILGVGPLAWLSRQSDDLALGFAVAWTVPMFIAFLISQIQNPMQ